MWMSDELEAVPLREVILWDLDRDAEWTGALTGTPQKPLPRVQEREIERVYGKKVHKGCGGDLRVTDKDCGHMKVGLVCETCGKEIVAEF